MAEFAGEGTAHLRGDAERTAILLRDMDGLGLLPVAKAQQPFAGPVAREEGTGGARALERITLRQLLAKGFRERRHRGKIAGAAVIDPMPELARTKAGR